MYHKSVAVRLAYGSMSLFIAILHNVFLLYYVDIFVSVYKIDRNSFWLGEVGAFVFVSSDMFCYVIKAMYCFWNIRSGTLNKIWIYAGIDAVRSCVCAWITPYHRITRFYSVFTHLVYSMEPILASFYK